MPETVVTYMIEELNRNNTLGAATTIMQKIASVSLYPPVSRKWA